MQVEAPKIIAIVHKDDYEQLRALLAGLPDSFVVWVQRRLLDRRAFEERTGRLAAVEQVDPQAFARYCRKTGLVPTEAGLDDWATTINWRCGR